MPSVYEQLQKYRAQNAKQQAALVARHPSVSVFSHPKTKEYFKNLMQRWQTGNQSTILSDTNAGE
jgi:hypothetical protein